ncbi:MAG: hypothetical protein GX774_10140 [Armatimonadetes bacterium]|jgi:hypothetical protein|nr:hypothetical protein [Armatimonadota bacterium]
MNLDLAIWALAALSTLAIFSILYRENPVYRLFEHIFIGLATGYGISILWTQVLLPNWWTPMAGDGKWPWIFALVVGLMFYTIYTPRYAWMSRLLMATLMGMSAGIFFQGFARLYIPQLAASFLPLVQPEPPYVLFRNLVIVVTIVTVMTYFFFSFEHRSKVVRGSASLGRWLLMIAFGAIFGSTVMARMALLTYRIWYLLQGRPEIGT